MANKAHEYMVLNLKKREKEGWVIEYLNEIYPKETYLTAMLDYLGLEGWKIMSSTHYAGSEEEELIYFSREFDRVAQSPKLQKLINEIDKRSNTHFAETSLSSENSEEDISILKQKILKHLYDWLKKHDFAWGEPGTGVRESHYLNKMEDVTDDAMFPDFHGVNKVSTRIDIIKESDRLRIVIKRRITDSWKEQNSLTFMYDKEGLVSIQSLLSMQHFHLISKDDV